MGIKVEFVDGSVEIGGAFNETLAWVKSLAGRKYDNASKTWSVAGELKANMQHCPFPYDVLLGDDSHAKYSSGNHVTRYGNSYSREEWQATQKVHNIELEGDYTRQMDDAYGALLDDLRASGAPEKVVVGVASEVMDGNSIKYLEEIGFLQFTSDERRQAFIAAEEKYFDTVNAIIEAEREEQANKEEAILEKYGLD